MNNGFRIHNNNNITAQIVPEGMGSIDETLFVRAVHINDTHLISHFINLIFWNFVSALHFLTIFEELHVPKLTDGQGLKKKKDCQYLLWWLNLSDWAFNEYVCRSDLLILAWEALAPWHWVRASPGMCSRQWAVNDKAVVAAVRTSAQQSENDLK